MKKGKKDEDNPHFPTFFTFFTYYYCAFSLLLFYPFTFSPFPLFRI